MEMFKIRIETKTIKMLLSELFLNEIFLIQLRQPSSYVYNSDKIIIKCPNSVNANDVIIALKKHAYGIDIFKKGSIGSIWAIDNTPYIKTPYIKMPNGNKIDMDMVEFIEVG